MPSTTCPTPVPATAATPAQAALRQRVRWLGAAALSLACALPLAQAQNQAGYPQASIAQELVALSQQWLEGALQQTQSAGLPLRMEVSVGQLDNRMRLTPCANVEPYLPPGTRLWGRTRMGLRCVDGQSRWNVFLPITVHAYGPAWVVSAPIAVGTVLSETDAMEAEVDWAAEANPIVANQDGWLGYAVTRPLAAGQTLRQGMVRQPDVFKAGAAVRVVAQGKGYAVTSSGKAMSAGSVGQSVRIRMANGRVISGTVAEDGSVEVVL